jgi:hypothetical protein
VGQPPLQHGIPNAASTRQITPVADVLSIWGRTAGTIATTAATLHRICAGRFILGLGASTRQLTEGFHEPRQSRQPRVWYGRYLMTYEVVNLSGVPNNFENSTNPDSWNPTDPGTTIDHGGSPYNTVLSNGKILYNSAGLDLVAIIATGERPARRWPAQTFGASRKQQRCHELGPSINGWRAS